MNDYETMKNIFDKHRSDSFINPTKGENGEIWKKDYETDYLLLNLSADILIVFDDKGNFEYFTTSY